jgi:hypothetical protein
MGDGSTGFNVPSPTAAAAFAAVVITLGAAAPVAFVKAKARNQEIT